MIFDRFEIKEVMESLLSSENLEADEDNMKKIVTIIKKKVDDGKIEIKFQFNEDKGKDEILKICFAFAKELVANHHVKSELVYSKTYNHVSDYFEQNYLSVLGISTKKLPVNYNREVKYEHINSMFNYERNDLTFNLKDYIGNSSYLSVYNDESHPSDINVSEIILKLKDLYEEIRKIVVYYRLATKVPKNENIYYPVTSIRNLIPQSERTQLHKKALAVSFVLGGVDPYDIVNDISKGKIDVPLGLFGIKDGCFLYSKPFLKTSTVGNKSYLVSNVRIDDAGDIDFLI